ncbi:phosphomannomutase/phosphoglucomutase [compost metagenome]
MRAHFLPQALRLDETDGISLEFDSWRFNLRGSNTEPLLRLNVETRGDQQGLQCYVSKLEQLILE